MASENPKKNPHDLVKREDVQKALSAAEGPSAILTSFDIVDFTTKGDNYACVVSSVKVTYEMDGESFDTSYVVKLNPCRPSEFLDKMVKNIFKKESGFYSEILPLLNEEFKRIKEDPLRVPKHYHSVATESDEVIYLQDMRPLGYKMVDRKKGMDKVHTILILKELARLHAISRVYMSSKGIGTTEVVEKFPILKDMFTQIYEEDPESKMLDWFGQSMENSAEIVDNIEGYDHISKYLRTVKEDILKVFIKTLKPEQPFEVICHGDCWNNNFLFRYDESGSPVECCLLDLQITRYSSPTIDLNYMFYSSLTGEVRQSNLEEFFAIYYANYASILSSDNKPVQFTIDQLKKDFYHRNKFGLVSGLSLIPIVLMDSEDTPNIDEFSDENMEEAMAEFKAVLMQNIVKNPLLKSRFLSMFDEMQESGLFDSY